MIQDADLLRTCASFTQPAPYLKFEVFCNGLLVSVEIIVEAHSGEVIPVHHHGDCLGLVPKATWTPGSGDESHVFKGGAVRVLPDGTRIASAIHASDLFRNQVAGKPKLFGEAHVQGPFVLPIEVRLAYIHKGKSQWLAVAIPLLGKPGERHLFRRKGWR